MRHLPTVLFFTQLTNKGMRHHDYFCVTGLGDSGYEGNPIIRSKSFRIFLCWALDIVKPRILWLQLYPYHWLT